MPEAINPIRTADFASAKKYLDEALTNRDSARIGLVLVHPSLILRRLAVDALGQIGTKADVPELIAALEQNQAVYGGGTEEKVLQEELNGALIAALQKMTGVNLSVIDLKSKADVRKALVAVRQWANENR